jgi:hypothetical protein
MPRELTPDEVFEALDGALEETSDAARADIFSTALDTTPWNELEIIEHDGYLYFPDKIYRRNRTGNFEATDIRIRVPRLPDIRKSRVRAHELAEETGIDAKRDPQEFAALESLCTLWRAIRSPKTPYEPLEIDELTLEKKYDDDSLTLVAKRMNYYREQLNPQTKKLTRADFLALIASVSERRDISPLAAIDGATQSAFIVTTACLLQSLMTAPSSSQSSEISTPVSSPTTDSTSSSPEEPSGTTS